MALIPLDERRAAGARDAGSSSPCAASPRTSSCSIALERLARDARVFSIPEDRELLDDAMVEMRQAAEMTTVSCDILGEMMDAFASRRRTTHRIRYVISSANPLFESAPDAFGANVIAVVLTGCNLDGTDGVQRVAEAGGSVIAEDPSSADHPRMPQSAIASGAVQYVLPLSAISSRIVQLVEERRPST